MARTQARRQQRERLAGIALAALGLVVLVVALFALREPNGHVGSAAPASTSGAAQDTTPSQSPSTRPSSPATASASSPEGSATSPGPDSLKSVPIVVLNNTTIQGLAQQAAESFKAGGWTVSSVGNLQNEILSTCAYFEKGNAQAKAAAKALRKQFPTIKRTEPKFPELPAGPVVVVLTPDYSSI